VSILLELGADPNAAPNAHPLRIAQAVRHRAIEAKLLPVSVADAAEVILPRSLPHSEFSIAPPSAAPAERVGSLGQAPRTVVVDKEKIWQSVRRLSARRPAVSRTPEASSPPHLSTPVKSRSSIDTPERWDAS
jgi:hypothetical protein